ncbi:hypothetical protein BJ912DRAFT_647224 [Pholiota molesta]|nr:hypothetical protein BJ912DRAFT_647224 [Pholiota molesta]
MFHSTQIFFLFRFKACTLLFLSALIFSHFLSGVCFHYPRGRGAGRQQSKRQVFIFSIYSSRLFNHNMTPCTRYHYSYSTLLLLILIYSGAQRGHPRTEPTLAQAKKN